MNLRLVLKTIIRIKSHFYYFREAGPWRRSLRGHFLVCYCYLFAGSAFTDIISMHQGIFAPFPQGMCLSHRSSLAALSKGQGKGNYLCNLIQHGKNYWASKDDGLCVSAFSFFFLDRCSGLPEYCSTRQVREDLWFLSSVRAHLFKEKDSQIRNCKAIQFSIKSVESLLPASELGHELFGGYSHRKGDGPLQTC